MSEKPSILYICFDPIPSPKGASTHVTYFIQALTERYDVTLISTDRTNESKESTYCGARHIPIALTQENFLDRALAFREAVWDHLEENRYDIVHFRTMWAALPVADLRKHSGFKSVCEVNAVDSIELKYHYPALRANPPLLEKLRAQEELAFNSSDALITPSEVTGNYLLRRVPESRVVVIPNGVDPELFRPMPSDCKSDGKLKLLYVGTLSPWQGLDFLLDALEDVVPVHPIRLTILSGGPRKWKSTLEKRVGKLGLTDSVEFADAVPIAQVGSMINKADICLAPLAPTERNVVQGCSPVKIFEYLACGKAIIASNLPVAREVLEDETNALLYKVSKPARLAECVLRLAGDADLRKRLEENALLTSRQCTWRRAQDLLLNVYSELLSRDS